MSNKSEISKDVDPSLNTDEGSEDPKPSTGDGVNGKDSPPEKSKSSTEPDMNQVSGEQGMPNNPHKSAEVPDDAETPPSEPVSSEASKLSSDPIDPPINTDDADAALDQKDDTVASPEQSKYPKESVSSKNKDPEVEGPEPNDSGKEPSAPVAESTDDAHATSESTTSKETSKEQQDKPAKGTADKQPEPDPQPDVLPDHSASAKELGTDMQLEESSDKSVQDKQPETDAQQEVLPDKSTPATESETDPQEVSSDKSIPDKEPEKDQHPEDEPDKKQPDKPPEKDQKQEEAPKPWDVDIKVLSKEALVKVIEQLVKYDDPIKAERVSRELKQRYNVIHGEERKQALDRFKSGGNDPDHFAYKFDQFDNRFDGAYKLIRDKKSQFIKNLERNKEQNLTDKRQLLEDLRALVDGEETTSSIQAVKKIQDQWRTVGPVPGQHVKALWANYHALMDRYYDQRSIYFELKELDRKKNLEAKLELCERAERLGTIENLREAINDLNELHEEFKLIGPVPKADQQAVWDRFKEASDKVYARRKEYIKHLKEDLKENQQKKLALAEEVQEFQQFNSERITDWNKKTKSILELQKKWESIGGLPKDQAKEINRKFWGAFKQFFHNKSLFFKNLEGERVANLEKKQVLLKQAESLMNSTDWSGTAEKLKQLQKEWRIIGPVPEKHRNSIYLKFKEACDTFFNNRRSQNQEIEGEYIENLKKKQQVCTEIESMTTAGNFDLDKFLDLKLQFNSIGYVPAAEVRNIRSQFTVSANEFLAQVPEELKDEARQIKYDIQFEKLKKGPHADRRKEQKEQNLRRDIGTLENDISTWKNNLEFFANSKTADKLKKEFTVKIEQASGKLRELKSQLRALRQI